MNQGEGKKKKATRKKSEQWKVVQALRKGRNDLLAEGKRCAFGTGNVVFVKVIIFSRTHHRIFTSLSCVGPAWRSTAVLDCHGDVSH